MAPSAPRQCLGPKVVIITVVTAFYHFVHGAGLMHATFESYESYKQGHSTGGTYVEAVARLVSAYAVVVSGAYLFLHLVLYFYDPRNSTLSFAETPAGKTAPYEDLPAGAELQGIKGR